MLYGDTASPYAGLPLRRCKLVAYHDRKGRGGACWQMGGSLSLLFRLYSGRVTFREQCQGLSKRVLERDWCDAVRWCKPKEASERIGGVGASLMFTHGNYYSAISTNVAHVTGQCATLKGSMGGAHRGDNTSFSLTHSESLPRKCFSGT